MEWRDSEIDVGIANTGSEAIVPRVIVLEPLIRDLQPSVHP